MMHSLKYKSFALFVLLLVAAPLLAQEQGKNMMIRLLDGRSGKAIKKEKLFIFFGLTPEEVSQKKAQIERYTDRLGDVTVPLDRPRLAALQVWTERYILCQPDPDHWSFSVDNILRKGEQSPNNCGKIDLPNTPGTLIIYARHTTRKERKAARWREFKERLRQ